MGEREVRRRWLALLLAPGLGGSVLDKAELDAARPEQLADLPERVLRGAGLSAKLRRAVERPDDEWLALCEDWLDHPRHHLVTLADPLYPPLLRRIDAPPLALFVNGDPEILLQPQVALVGSRNATGGGLEIAGEFAAALAGAGFAVTSGLALGVDGAAHRAAMDAGGKTIAVAGTGPDQVYPARHRELARRIVDNGAVISSFAPGVGPRPGHFPARNRIISGMSAGVVVIEAGEHSGSLITARLAGEQGREVFAVPGSIRNPMARGCHRLIRQGARLVEHPDEVIGELGPLVGELAGELRGILAGDDPGPSDGDRSALPDDRAGALLDAVGYDPVSIDQIIVRSGMSTQAVSALLLELELEGRVESLGGGRYCRTGTETGTP